MFFFPSFRHVEKFFAIHKENFSEIWTKSKLLCYNITVMKKIIYFPQTIFIGKRIYFFEEYKKRTSFWLGKAQDL